MSALSRLLVICLAALALAAGASADNGVSARGALVAVTAKAVSVQDARGVVLTCRLADRSPSLDGYAVGDRVQIVCARVHDRLVLAKVRHLTAAPTAETQPVTFAGAIAALTDTTISLHDGDRDLTCTIGRDSPSTQGLAVGQHVRVACVGGTLTKLAVITTGTEPPHRTTGAQGTVTAVSSASISVQTDGGTVTCAVGDRSPSVAGYQIGDKVKMGCIDGALAVIAKVDAPPPAPAGDTISGTITALSATSITVHNAERDLTCTVGASSPALGDYKLGDAVGMGCVDGALVKIVKRT